MTSDELRKVRKVQFKSDELQAARRPSISAESIIANIAQTRFILAHTHPGCNPGTFVTFLSLRAHPCLRASLRVL